MNRPEDTRCDDGRMEEVLALAQSDVEQAVAAIEALLTAFPLDARLHFLKGSLLIGLERFVGAHHALSRALDVDPDYHLARFQLGFFELTSGEAAAARQTWQPLSALPAEHWIRLFVTGLNHLAEDRFAECVAALRSGIAANDENGAVNGDMQIIIDQCEALAAPTGESSDDAGEISATSVFLKRERWH